jgi:hypothetical protein
MHSLGQHVASCVAVRDKLVPSRTLSGGSARGDNQLNRRSLTQYEANKVRVRSKKH